VLDLSDGLSRSRERRARLEAELRRLSEAVAQNGASRFLRDAIGEREKALLEISDQLLSDGPQSVEAELAEIRSDVTTRLADIRSLLAKNVPLARVEREVLASLANAPGVLDFYVWLMTWGIIGLCSGSVYSAMSRSF
jgi:hypothetical protein